MVLVSVMYPSGSRFDVDYYLGTHIPLVKERWGGLGLTHVQLVRGAKSGTGGEPTFQVMALLSFASEAEFQNAAKTHGREIFADIPKFTDGQPVVQINEVLA